MIWNYRRGIVLVAAVVMALLTARLGLWQLDRAEQKLSLQAQIDSRSVMPPLRGEDLAREASLADEQHQRQASLRGRWLPEHTVFLENRQMRGQPGFFVLTPLLLADGHSVMVQRGWQPRDLLDRSKTAAVPSAPGIVQVQGRIAPPPSRLYEFAPSASGPIRQNLDIGDFGRETGLMLLPLSLLQTGDPTPADGLQREWLQPTATVHKHYGYAVQWFALSALVIGLYVWFQILAPRRRAARI